MDNLKRVIDNQIELNAGKNLYYGEESLFSFSDKLPYAIDSINKIDDYSLNILIDYAVDKCLLELCRVNQYYDFNTQSRDELKCIYITLIRKIKSKNNTINKLIENHRINLKNWLSKTNPFSNKIYASEHKTLSPVACSEYHPDLQLEILKINIDRLIKPVLDIGCGTKANLVVYLRKKGIEAFGIDRFAPNLSYTKNFDWLEYDYGIQKWGTIISNLGFSNHFRHHHLRKDGHYIDYAKKYMQILNSLKIGGSFHYAPALPFIEQFLDTSAYQIFRHRTEDSEFQSVRVERVK